MERIFIIAEAGVNHNGNLEIAKKLVDTAVKAGADAVKFQTFKAENLVCRNAKKAEYQLETTSGQETQFEMLKRLEFTEEMHHEIIAYCEEKDIMFLSTPFDVESVALLEKLEIPLYKIPSGEITNYPYLRAIGRTKKKVILSTGMSSLEEIEKAVSVLKSFGSNKIILLHCNTEYPTPMRDVNLKAMDTIREKLHLPVGYSDHTEGIEVSLAAAAMGAVVIEKHFTLDKNMEGPDHKASLTPEELIQMVQAIRNIEVAEGVGEKNATQSELKNIPIARKSIVAARRIEAGEIFTEENLTTKRPGTGIPPMEWESMIGSCSKRAYKQDELIEK